MILDRNTIQLIVTPWQISVVRDALRAWPGPYTAAQQAALTPQERDHSIERLALASELATECEDWLQDRQADLA